VWWLARRGKTQTSKSACDIKGWIGVGAGSAIGTILTVSPWLVRNWLVFGVPILTTTHGGYTLLLGNNSVFTQDVVQQPWGTVWS
ncbi:hypothetical protein ABTN32_20465, partial [Acinetobacter baumannii]